MSLLYDPNFETSKNQESTYTDNGWIIESIKKSTYLPDTLTQNHLGLQNIQTSTDYFDVSFGSNSSLYLAGGGPNGIYNYYWILNETGLSPHNKIAEHWNAHIIPSYEGGDWSSYFGGESSWISSILFDSNVSGEGGYAFKMSAVNNKLYVYLTNESNEIPYECTICARGTFSISSSNAYRIDFNFLASKISNVESHTRIDLFAVDESTNEEFYFGNNITVWPNQLLYADGDHPTNSTDYADSLGVTFVNGVSVFSKYFLPGAIPSGTYKFKIRFYTGYIPLLDYTWFGQQGVRYELHSCNLSVATGVPVIHELEMGGNQGSVPLIDFNKETPLVIPDIITEGLETFIHPLPSGWSMFSIPLDITTIPVGHNAHPDKSSDDLGIDDGEYDLYKFLQNHLYYSVSEIDVPIYYLPVNYTFEGQSYPGCGGGTDVSAFNQTIIIAKDYLGAAYLPQFNFNGIGDINQLWGYQIKLGGPFGSQTELRYKGSILFDTVLDTDDVSFDLTNGWQFLCYPSLVPTDAYAFFEPLLANNNLIIAKDYLGSAFLPEFNFNGVGALMPGQAYQVKLTGIV